MTEWGPSIKTNGKRPEWLADGEPVYFEFADALGGPRASVVTQQVSWPHLPSFRLVAHHSQYALTA